MKIIKLRRRRGYLREAMGYTAWDEYQVWGGRRIVGRYELLSQAQRDHGDAAVDRSALPEPAPKRRRAREATQR